jgi:hypothetical protein
MAAFGALPAPSASEKMKPEEVVAKHLAAIGTSEALGSLKSIVAGGESQAFAKNTAVKELKGPSQIGSEGEKFLLAMVFNSANYPYEKVGYDSQKVTVALLPEGKRTLFCDFLKSNESIVKEGLLGGTLSTAWPLLNLTARGAKLSYSGTKKIDDRPAHEIKYNPRKGGGGLQITLFFDAETFHHVRTEYQRVIPARMGPTATESAAQQSYRYKLIEEFSDFKTEGQLTLPHTYKIRYTMEEQSTRMFEWLVTLSQFSFNEPIDPKAFNLAPVD